MPPRKRQALIASVNVVGPDGSLCLAGAEIPAEWIDHPEFDADHLEASGGATRKKG